MMMTMMIFSRVYCRRRHVKYLTCFGRQRICENNTNTNNKNNVVFEMN